MTIKPINDGARDGVRSSRNLYNNVKGNEEKFYINFKQSNKTENDAEVFDEYGR